MSVVEQIKEGLKAAALAMSVVTLATITYFFAVELPVKLNGVNLAFSNLMEKAMPVVDNCKKLTDDLTNTENEDSLRGEIGGIVAGANRIVGAINKEVETKGGLGAVAGILREMLLNRNGRSDSPPRSPKG